MLPSMCWVSLSSENHEWHLRDAQFIGHSVNERYEAAVQRQHHPQYSTFWASLAFAVAQSLS